MHRAETIATLWSQNRDTLKSALLSEDADADAQDVHTKSVFGGNFSAEEITNYRRQLVTRVKEVQDIGDATKS